MQSVFMTTSKSKTKNPEGGVAHNESGKEFSLGIQSDRYR